MTPEKPGTPRIPGGMVVPMSEMQTTVRTELGIDGRSYYLAQGQDLGALREAIEEAARTHAKFVDFVVVGNRSVSVLITRRTQVAFSVETVQFDPRDTGDQEAPYGGAYDF